MDEVAKRTLPRQVVYKDKEAVELERLQRKVDAAKTAYRELKTMADFAGVLPNVEDINEGFTSEIVHRAVEAIYESRTMTAKDKDIAVNQWKSLESKANSYVQQIKAASDLLTFRTKGDSIEPEEDLEVMARKLCTRATPPRAYEHYELVQNMIEALSNLRNWERDNEIPSLWLCELERLEADPTRFATEWTKGAFAPVSAREQEIKERYGNGQRVNYRY